MTTKASKSSKLTLVSLVLMIFTSVFGFANMPRSFYLMGYGAIPWYILSAITFFVLLLIPANNILFQIFKIVGLNDL